MKVAFGYFLYLSIASFLAFTDIMWSANTRFLILTVILVMYNTVELSWLYRTNKKYFFINPIFLAVIANFFAYLGGISNFLLLKDGIYVIDNLAAPLLDERYWLNYTMGYTCIAAFFMWMGYKLSAGRKLSNIFLKGFQYEKFLGSKIKLGLILLLAVVGYGIKLYLLDIGLYGRINDQATHGDSAFLYSNARMLGNLSMIPFIFIALLYFQKKTTLHGFLFLTVFGLEFFFASITGARSPVIILSLLVFLAYYFNSRKIGIGLLLYVILSLYLAFTIIMQFKDYVIAKNPVGLSPIELVTSFFEYRENLSETEQDRIYGAILFNFANRVNFVDEAAMAIRYKEVEGIKHSDPDFLRPLITIPFDIVVPKSIQGTPNVSWGLWFKREVFKNRNDLIYNIAFSPIGYLYLAGGPLLILLGFFTYGILLKAAYQFLNNGLLGFLIFLLMLSSVVIYKTGVATVYVGFFRVLLLAPIFVGLSFKQLKLN